MRSLSLVLAMSFSCPTFATANLNEAPSVVATDDELWESLVDLRRRFAIVRTVRASTKGVGASGLMAISGVTAIMLAGQCYPRVRGAGTLVAASSALGVLFFFGMQIGACVSDRSGFEPQNRMFAANDLGQTRVRAILAVEDLLKRPLREQYAVASEDEGLRAYIIQLDQWMRAGVAGGAPVRSTP